MVAPQPHGSSSAFSIRAARHYQLLIAARIVTFRNFALGKAMPRDGSPKSGRCFSRLQSGACDILKDGGGLNALRHTSLESFLAFVGTIAREHWDEADSMAAHEPAQNKLSLSHAHSSLVSHVAHIEDLAVVTSRDFMVRIWHMHKGQTATSPSPQTHKLT